MSSVLLESAAGIRPFKSSEEYLYAMKEDLAEWLQLMYPHLGIGADNFMERLETGVALCEHANGVKSQAAAYVARKRRRASSRRAAHRLSRVPDVKYFSTARPGTFFARDNVSNFIEWCRASLEIIECLLFESDDLILRKNEKHVVLCLLEVARRGARFGVPAPTLVRMERQIDREIGVVDSDSDDDDGAVQIVTNDLKGLDEMVRELVEKCTCPTQFPMIRVSEGKYRIGDTKVLIFVRILRNHVMVRVGGGWDTLSHYLDKHDPCRCKTQHRATQGAKLVGRPATSDLHGAHVVYERSATPLQVAVGGGAFLGPPMNSLNRSRSPSQASVGRKTSLRSRSPTPNPVKPKSKTRNEVPIDQLTDHSDTTSEMSDEGYRSLGLVNHKPDGDVNDAGLRKTQFSRHVGEPETKKLPRQRSSLGAFESPFARHSATRRSASALGERKAASAHTSPTKTTFKDELLRAVRTADDDAQMALQVQQLLKQFGGLGDEPREDRRRASFRTSRKDSRPDNVFTSKIPTPKVAANK